ncbi:tetratricopeptide repeat protein, putative [Plasmodium reichenowi]|uniref:Tetratricopeptide repeat protein, putative n=1 Tax=Plasmodium reichenowi TaxID=5854 RepID=A0A151LQ17_PLARE|nr:tetratricopeptide repeat protein, putative [Plasmodium reichenowi]KYO01189.1 tetratricopeptide repeat protein, putative [Plasmodium reichenowi]
MGAFGSKNLEYYNYASMKLLEVENYENDEELYFKEHDIDEIIKKARDIRNFNYKESLDLYFKALKILKKLKDNNNKNKIYKNILEFEIRPQELKNNSIKLNTHCIKHNDYNNKDQLDSNSTLSDEKNICINKQIASLYNEIGDLCCIHDFIDKSLYYYDKACSYNPSKIEYIYKKGVLYQQMNNTEKAIKTFKLILSNDENHIPTLFSLGNLYRYIDNNIALSYFEAILKKEPDNTEVLSLIASCYDNLGKINEAISYQNKAVHIDPDNFNHKKFAQRLIEMTSQN